MFKPVIFVFLAFTNLALAAAPTVLVPGVPLSQDDLSERDGLAVDANYVYYSETVFAKKNTCNISQVDKLSGKLIAKILDGTDCFVEQIFLSGDTLYFSGGFQKEQGIYSISVSTHEMKQLVAMPGNEDILVASDSTSLYWLEAATQSKAIAVNKFDLSNGTTTELWKGSADTVAEEDKLVVDDTNVYFGVNAADPQLPQSQLFIVAKSGGQATVVPQGADDIAALASDGNFLYVASSDQGGFAVPSLKKLDKSGQAIRTFPLESGFTIIDAAEDSNIGLIPVGNLIYFSMADVKFNEYFASLNLDDGTIQKITESPLTDDPENYHDFGAPILDGTDHWYWLRQNHDTDESIIEFTGN